MEEQNYVQRCGGTLAEAPSNSEEDTGCTQDQLPKAAKRNRNKISKSPDSEEIGKGAKRGRPRVDPQDESAVERRRTQIRLAQRAYRERKETTISVLERRVAELQRTVSQINETFIDYNERVMASGIGNLDPALQQHLKTTTERIVELAQNAKQESDSEEAAQVSTGTRQHYNLTEEQTVPPEAATRRNRRMTSPQTSRGMDVNHPASMLGYQVTYEAEDIAEGENDPTIEQGEPENFREYTNETSNWDGHRMEMQQYRAEVPEVPAMTQTYNIMADSALKPVSSYSSQERTFSRRLLRNSYERAYYCLSKANCPLEEIDRLYKFNLRYTLCYAPPQYIAANLGGMIKRTANESLENWIFPLQHIGRAGLHYERSSLDSQDPLPENWSDLQAMGPYPPKNPWVPVSEQDYPGNLVEFADVEGEWYDANDVEHYLRSKGLFISERASIAAIEVEEPVPALTGDLVTGSPDSNSAESSVDPQSPPHADMFPNTYPASSTSFSEAGNHVFDPGFANADSNVIWPTEDAPKFLDANQSFMFPDLSGFAPRKRKLTIDVEKLMYALNEKAVCLGRAPGYRPADVDEVFNMVIQEAY